MEQTSGAGTGLPDSSRSAVWPGYLLIAIAPAVLIIGADLLVRIYGWPQPAEAIGVDPALRANPGSTFVATSEIAMRLRILTTSLLLWAACVSVLAFFIVTIVKADRASRRLIIGGWLGMAALVGLFFAVWSPYKTQELLGQSVFCEAASVPGPIVLKAGAQPDTSESRPKIAYAVPGNCAAQPFKNIMELVFLVQIPLALAVPALVFGSILSLRTGGGRPAADGEGADQPPNDAELKTHINRLNTWLYLSAFLLVSGLLFLSSYLRYPTFALRAGDAPSFTHAVEAIILLFAVTYSLFIASYYVPIAALLAHRCALLRQGGMQDDHSTGIVAPLQILKVGAAILSPIIASLLGEVIKLPGV